MRRYLLPAVVLVVAITASVLMSRADDDANPGDPAAVEASPSLGTPLLNVRRAPEWLRQPANDDLLASAVRATIGNVAETNPVCLSVRRDGASIAEVNSDAPFTPGELQRLVTLAAFDSQGSRGYVTEVVRRSDEPVTEGILEGNLWLIGGADPVLSTAAFIDRFGDDRASTSLDDLAQAVVAALRSEGITEIRGAVIGDESKYAPVERVYPPGTWSEADVATNTVGPISALLVNNGFDRFPEVVDPPADSRSSNPAIHAAQQLSDLIEVAGIPVSGSPVDGIQPEADSRVPLATIESPSISAIARRALVDGTTAEMMFREVGQRSGLGGSQVGSLFAVGDALVNLGVLDEADKTTIVTLDGSGLSRITRTRCDVLTGILDLGPGSLVVDSLPSVTDSPLAACAQSGLDSLRAYTAAREDVTAMAGRAVASNGDILTFAVIVNWLPDAESGELAPRAACDGVLPALLDAIAGHPSGPAIDQLSPLDPVAIS
jgi:serine-type D-Ala-D-Ala carboxypeptidase/endopeptidase (penicillin-binding protein 4)